MTNNNTIYLSNIDSMTSVVNYHVAVYSRGTTR